MFDRHQNRNSANEDGIDRPVWRAERAAEFHRELGATQSARRAARRYANQGKQEVAVKGTVNVVKPVLKAKLDEALTRWPHAGVA